MRYVTFLMVFLPTLSLAQVNLDKERDLESSIRIEASINKKPSWSPSPIKAALYSTVFPGLGQVYNKKYWKAPVVLAGLSLGIFLSSYEKDEYDKAYKDYVDQINSVKSDGLGAKQLDLLKEHWHYYYTYCVLFTAVFYVLNIVDAFVDAHLYEMDHNKNLFLSPVALLPKSAQEPPSFGLVLNFVF